MLISLKIIWQSLPVAALPRVASCWFAGWVITFFWLWLTVGLTDPRGFGNVVVGIAFSSQSRTSGYGAFFAFLGLWLVASLCSIMSYRIIGETHSGCPVERAPRHQLLGQWVTLGLVPPGVFALLWLLTFVPVVLYGALGAVGDGLGRWTGLAWAWPTLLGLLFAIGAFYGSSAKGELWGLRRWVSQPVAAAAGFVIGFVAGPIVWGVGWMLLGTCTGAIFVLSTMIAALGTTILGPAIVLGGSSGAMARSIQLVLRDVVGLTLRWLFTLFLICVWALVVEVLGNRAEHWTRNATSRGAWMMGAATESSAGLVEQAWPAPSMRFEALRFFQDREEIQQPFLAFGIGGRGATDQSVEDKRGATLTVFSWGPWVFLGLKLSLVSAYFCALQVGAYRASAWALDGVDPLDDFPPAIDA